MPRVTQKRNRLRRILASAGGLQPPAAVYKRTIYYYLYILQSTCARSRARLLLSRQGGSTIPATLRPGGAPVSVGRKLTKSGMVAFLRRLTTTWLARVPSCRQHRVDQLQNGLHADPDASSAREIVQSKEQDPRCDSGMYR
eukprot:1194580-Prorocentrum_minimum.AAC.8